MNTLPLQFLLLIVAAWVNRSQQDVIEYFLSFSIFSVTPRQDSDTPDSTMPNCKLISFSFLKVFKKFVIWIIRPLTIFSCWHSWVEGSKGDSLSQSHGSGKRRTSAGQLQYFPSTHPGLRWSAHPPATLSSSSSVRVSCNSLISSFVKSKPRAFANFIRSSAEARPSNSFLKS